MELKPYTVLIFLIVRIELANSTRVPKAVAGAVFEDNRPGKKLVDQKNVSKKLGSLTSCSHSCNRAANCLSFNFCHNFICELNSEDVFSTELGEDLLQEDSTCTYFGMDREEMPLCKEEDNHVDIQVYSKLLYF